MRSQFLKHIPCPECGSKDNNSLYDDGHTTCYGCGHQTFPDKDKNNVVEKAPPPKNIRPIPAVFNALKERGLTADTLKFFKVTSVQDPESNVVAVYPRFDKDGRHVANKLRLKDKDFSWEGDAGAALPFGMNLFQKGGRAITLVEGQDDAMAYFQMTGSKYPVWSADSAQAALKQAKDCYEYLNSFETIVINFDNDGGRLDGKNPGRDAAISVANIFPIGKVRILQLPEGKDANDYLLKGWSQKYVDAWWRAPQYTPSGLKYGRDLWDEISTEQEFETVLYPWESTNHFTYGMRLSEVVLLTADTGVGKTSVVRRITHKLIKEGKSVGGLFLEEPNKDTALGLMSIEAQKPLHLPDVREKVEKDELRKYFDAVVNNDRLVIWDHFGSNSVEEVINKIRHMAALGCKYIILDHLSIVVSDQSGDERKQLDEISTKLKMLCMELNIAIVAVIHQNRQGQIRASAGPEQIANIIFKLFRDKEEIDPWRRNVMKVMCQKNRFCGRTGPMTWLWYNEDTGDLEELSDADAKLYESGGSKFTMTTEEVWM